MFSWKTFQLTWFKLTLWSHSKRELYIVLSLDNWFHFPFFLLLQIILLRLVVSAWIDIRSKKQFTKLAISPCPLKLNPCLQSVGSSSLWSLLRSKQLCCGRWNNFGITWIRFGETLSQLWSALRSKQLVCAHCPAGNQGSRLRRTHLYNQPQYVHNNNQHCLYFPCGTDTSPWSILHVAMYRFHLGWLWSIHHTFGIVLGLALLNCW